MSREVPFAQREENKEYMAAIKAGNVAGLETQLNKDFPNTRPVLLLNSLLLEAVNPKNKPRDSVLRNRVIEKLLEKGAHNKGAPLCLAVDSWIEGKEDRKFLDFLLTKIDINETQLDKKTALHSATLALVNGASPKYVEFLLSKGADANAPLIDGTTPFHLLFTALANGHSHSDLIKLAIRNGANVNIAKKDGTTALHIALEAFEKGHGNHDSIKFLLRNGADINAAKKGGTTALHIAAELLAKGKIDTSVITTLLGAGANVVALRNLSPNGTNGESPFSILESANKAKKLSSSALSQANKLFSAQILRPTAGIVIYNREDKGPFVKSTPPEEVDEFLRSTASSAIFYREGEAAYQATKILIASLQDAATLLRNIGRKKEAGNLEHIVNSANSLLTEGDSKTGTSFFTTLLPKEFSKLLKSGVLNEKQRRELRLTEEDLGHYQNIRTQYEKSTKTSRFNVDVVKPQDTLLSEAELSLSSSRNQSGRESVPLKPAPLKHAGSSSTSFLFKSLAGLALSTKITMNDEERMMKAAQEAIVDIATIHKDFLKLPTDFNILYDKIFARLGDFYTENSSLLKKANTTTLLDVRRLILTNLMYDLQINPGLISVRFGTVDKLPHQSAHTQAIQLAPAISRLMSAALESSRPGAFKEAALGLLGSAGIVTLGMTGKYDQAFLNAENYKQNGNLEGAAKTMASRKAWGIQDIIDLPFIRDAIYINVQNEYYPSKMSRANLDSFKDSLEHATVELIKTIKKSCGIHDTNLVGSKRKSSKEDPSLSSGNTTDITPLSSLHTSILSGHRSSLDTNETEHSLDPSSGGSPQFQGRRVSQISGEGRSVASELSIYGRPMDAMKKKMRTRSKVASTTSNTIPGFEEDHYSLSSKGEHFEQENPKLAERERRKSTGDLPNEQKQDFRTRRKSETPPRITF